MVTEERLREVLRELISPDPHNVKMSMIRMRIRSRLGDLGPLKSRLETIVKEIARELTQVPGVTEPGSERRGSDSSISALRLTRSNMGTEIEMVSPQDHTPQDYTPIKPNESYPAELEAPVEMMGQQMSATMAAAIALEPPSPTERFLARAQRMQERFEKISERSRHAGTDQLGDAITGTLAGVDALRKEDFKLQDPSKKVLAVAEFLFLQTFLRLVQVVALVLVVRDVGVFEHLGWADEENNNYTFSEKYRPYIEWLHKIEINSTEYVILALVSGALCSITYSRRGTAGKLVLLQPWKSAVNDIFFFLGMIAEQSTGDEAVNVNWRNCDEVVWFNWIGSLIFCVVFSPIPCFRTLGEIVGSKHKRKKTRNRARALLMFISGLLHVLLLVPALVTFELFQPISIVVGIPYELVMLLTCRRKIHHLKKQLILHTIKPLWSIFTILALAFPLFFAAVIQLPIAMLLEYLLSASITSTVLDMRWNASSDMTRDSSQAAELLLFSSDVKPCLLTEHDKELIQYIVKRHNATFMEQLSNTPDFRLTSKLKETLLQRDFSSTLPPNVRIVFGEKEPFEVVYDGADVNVKRARRQSRANLTAGAQHRRSHSRGGIAGLKKKLLKNSSLSDIHSTQSYNSSKGYEGYTDEPEQLERMDGIELRDVVMEVGFEEYTEEEISLMSDEQLRHLLVKKSAEVKYSVLVGTARDEDEQAKHKITVELTKDNEFQMKIGKIELDASEVVSSALFLESLEEIPRIYSPQETVFLSLLAEHGEVGFDAHIFALPSSVDTLAEKVAAEDSTTMIQEYLAGYKGKFQNYYKVAGVELGSRPAVVLPNKERPQSIALSRTSSHPLPTPGSGALLANSLPASYSDPILTVPAAFSGGESRRLNTLSVDEVVSVLSHYKLERYEHVIRANDVDGTALRYCSEATDLESLDMSSLHAKKLLGIAQQFRDHGVPLALLPSAPPPPLPPRSPTPRDQSSSLIKPAKAVHPESTPELLNRVHNRVDSAEQQIQDLMGGLRTEEPAAADLMSPVDSTAQS